MFQSLKNNSANKVPKTKMKSAKVFLEEKSTKREEINYLKKDINDLSQMLTVYFTNQNFIFQRGFLIIGAGLS